MTIRRGIFLSYILITAIGIYYLTHSVINELRPRYLESIEESLVDSSNLLASLVTQALHEQDNVIHKAKLERIFAHVHTTNPQAQIYGRLKNNIDVDIYITDAKGFILYDSRAPEKRAKIGADYSHWRDVKLTLQGKYGARSTKDDPSNPTASTLYVASPMIKDGKLIGVLTLCKPTTGLSEFIHTATQKVIRTGIYAGLGTIMLGLLISFWLTHPISALTQYARQVRDGQRVKLPQLFMARELKKLGFAFEEMRDALEGRQYVEQYVQTLTHELKSPVSAIRGAAELLQERMSLAQRHKFLTNIKNEAQRITGIIEKMLRLASLESIKSLETYEPIDLNPLIQQTINSRTPLLMAKQLSLQMNLEDHIYVKGDAFLLHQAILNLLQNAIDFSPKKGAIQVSLTCKNAIAYIMIEDQGTGIPEYAQDKIFDRFYSLPRPDSKHKSSGLGLPFVKEVATLHGGEIQLTKRNNQDSGTKAQLQLPIASS
ncbi:MAG: two-component system sensor histidine kinase CreC [Verrucomicrobiota bacterium]